MTHDARVIGLGLSDDGANEIARRSRGTPRIAGRLLRRVRDFAVVEGAAIVSRAIADGALRLLEVDASGTDLPQHDGSAIDSCLRQAVNQLMKLGLRHDPIVARPPQW